MIVEAQFHCSDYLNTWILAAASTSLVCIHQHYMIAKTQMLISQRNNIFNLVSDSVPSTHTRFQIHK